ncbi:Schizosaccharomyces specific protein [Schizosaccharomyces osmophilus]|uniref:Schizosaccharomyces specific protein n=1 Tax=Schizosaccharomyces osmophilus TaxID=2545709 RepID=A0AAE9WE29_9SCHI|nr:Schizosaccharomyces specific protein [Schizosaccharomyces osmophilus]WBW74632.1 Schizosaccharomyces specific protein [Schizosaccharomyces osmophilus]
MVLVKFKREKTSIFVEITSNETLKNAVDKLRDILKVNDDQAMKIGALQNGDYVAVDPSTWSNSVLSENTDYAFANEGDDFLVHQPSDEDVMESEG